MSSLAFVFYHFKQFGVVLAAELKGVSCQPLGALMQLQQYHPTSFSLCVNRDMVHGGPDASSGEQRQMGRVCVCVLQRDSRRSGQAGHADV